MRMTNKIMRNNSLYNINQNKILEDKLSNQMTNQSKITRPSDDPVVAIRALRLRTNVTTVTQYYDKNAPDADSWLTITGDALNTVGSVLKKLYEQVEDASKKSLKSEDLEIILTQIEALTKEFYASGNVDYAGRYVFSGFRTDTPITFTTENINEFTKDPDNLKTYVIEESRTYQDITTVSYTDWTDVKTDATGNPLGDENDITNTTLYRFRLSYDDLNLTKDAAGNVVQPPTNDFELSINGTPTTVTAYSDAEAAYQAVKDNPGQIAYIASTGEIVFSEEAYQNPKDVLGINIDSIEDIQIDVKYAKSNWQAGDLNPVHYFHCVATDQANQTQAMDLKSKQDDLMQAQIDYSAVRKEYDPKLEAAQKALEDAKRDLRLANANGDPAQIAAAQQAVDDARADVADAQQHIDDAQTVLDAAQAEVDKIMNVVVEYNADNKYQDIYYNVGYNQTIQVNTHADEVFTHGAQRDLDDFKIYLKQLKDVEAKITDIEAKMQEYPEDSQMFQDLQKQLAAMNKAQTYIRDNVQTKFENQITSYQKYIDVTNVAVTNNGTRGSRLSLITDRLMNQKATFKDLQSNNEDVDVTEVAVQLKSSELTYEAALMATSKIMQTNLMNYI